MNNPPPLMRDQRIVDREHLRLLAIFHFVVAGLAIVGIGFLFLHYCIFSSFFAHPEMWQPKPGPNGTSVPPVPPIPPGLFDMLKWVYVVLGFLLLLVSIGNLLSGFFLRARKHRVFSLIVAGLDCLQIPFGTLLGVFTIVVLVRESVVELYQNNSPS
jgi:hypothetical protein